MEGDITGQKMHSKSVTISETTVCVVGLGYIGLPTAGVLARRGYQVLGVDVRPEVVEAVNAGKIPFHEPDLEQLIQTVVGDGRLAATFEPAPADIFMICVPTPINDDRSPDVSYVEAAARAIRPYIRPGNLIVLESTSPPHTTEQIVAWHAVPPKLAVGTDVFVAHCPERVLPGRILAEVVGNDRIVGGVTRACTEKAKAFFKTFVKGDVCATNALVAEITKLVENAYRDVNIALANELSVLAEHLGADAWEVICLANRHPRVNILNPGPGVGGHCIGVDPWFLVHAAPEHTALLQTAREVNDGKPEHVVRQVLELAGNFTAPTVGCLGLTYKADVDDLRESPSLEIVRRLQSTGTCRVLACDPYVRSDNFREFPLHSLDEVLAASDVIVLLTDHMVFRELSPSMLEGKAIVDTRGIWRDDPGAAPGFEKGSGQARKAA